MTPFDDLLRELDAWNFEGEEATLWWRDDDAAEPEPRLSRLLSLLDSFDVPLALAAIPGCANRGLAEQVSRFARVAVVQHGVAHENHAPPERKKQELVETPERGWEQILTSARGQLEGLFGERFRPVMVPPWNRIDASVAILLDTLGYRGLSCFGPRKLPQYGEELWLVNTHADIVNWRDGRRFAGAPAVIDALVNHLGGRREGRFDRAEPTGILSHHLVHDDETFDFLEELLSTLDDHPAVTWLSVDRVFQLPWR